MTSNKIDELHKSTEILLSKYTEHIDNSSPEYISIKAHVVNILKTLTELRIKSITENHESNTRKNNN